MVAERVPETADLRKCCRQLDDDKTLSDYNIQNEISHVVNTIEVEKSRIITDTDRAIREEEPFTQEKINQVIEHIKILQIQHTDKIANVSVAMQGQFPQSQRSSAGDCFPIREELEFRYCERAVQRRRLVRGI